uniref:LOW QUALITY PROTEIN: cell cycle regulator of non-homologous end joining n=1 Tax=Myodes glareolus TaxID=447135 RepID=UPI002020FB3B|nr:LOW QUALITY PROTEIN: cell cycle regulator of non-homologous end joining [Myodes glareolus]
METPKSENKKRVLPSWMTAPGDERRELSAKTPKRKRRAAVQDGAATRAPATKTVYCMNEPEMVDVALGILIEDRKQETQSLETADRLQLSLPYSASPHTSSPGSSSEEEGSGSSSPALDLSPSRGPEAADSPCSSSPQEEKEEEDVLKSVRKIFFS